MRAEEGGVLARKAKWAKWASKKAVPWEGSRRAVQIAFALLHARDYFWALSSSTMTDQYVSMANMLEKGEVFVCLRCPREAQMKRNWKELVRLYLSYFQISDGLIMALSRSSTFTRRHAATNQNCCGKSDLALW